MTRTERVFDMIEGITDGDAVTDWYGLIVRGRSSYSHPHFEIKNKIIIIRRDSSGDFIAMVWRKQRWSFLPAKLTKMIELAVWPNV